MKTYRNNGAIGAILDEYEKALLELKVVLADVTHEDLMAIVDNKTLDKDCESIQSILTHVIRAGYCYVMEIRKHLGEQITFVERERLDSIEAYQEGLDKMFRYNEQLFEDYPNINIEENDPTKKILVRWGQRYDVDQLYEHAIVHVLRHRRQIERFLIKLKEV